MKEKNSRSVASEKRLKISKRRKKVPKKILLVPLKNLLKDPILVNSGCKNNIIIIFPKVLFRKSINLVSKSLFRALPHSSENPATSIVFAESFYIQRKKYDGESLSFQDPSWPHLESVYQFLSLLLKSPSTNQKLVGRLKLSFILNLLDVFQSKDGRERNALASALQVIYQKFHVHREFIRNSVFNLLYSCANEKHNGIQEFLTLVTSMSDVEQEECMNLSVSGNHIGPRRIQGNSEIQEEFKVFLVRGLIPLYKSNWLVLFYLHLNSCIDKFVKNDCELAGIVIKGMLRHWPMASSSREYFFLDGVERVLLETQPDDFRSYMVSLFRRIAGCLSSPHFKVAKKGLSFFKNEGKILNLIKQNMDVIFPIIFEDLSVKAINHWQPETRKLAHRVLKSLLNGRH